MTHGVSQSRGQVHAGAAMSTLGDKWPHDRMPATDVLQEVRCQPRCRRCEFNAWLAERCRLIEGLRDNEKRLAGEHVSSQWIYGNHMNAARACDAVLRILREGK